MGTPGYVYLLQPVGHNVYKIGCSTDVERRMKTLQRRRGYKLQCIARIWSGNHTQLEQWIHRKFKHYRLDGEWYALSTEAVEQFKLWAVENVRS